ncbi:YkoF-like protein [Coniochaeta sp. 2T2.1]|nr:YkoF-like protein [Coniochaeta sp. 2T2.1]
MTTLLRSSRILTTTTTRLSTIKPLLLKPVFGVKKMDYSSIPTPQRCYADFCLIPVGTGSASVAKEIAGVQRLLQASGLKCTMHSAGTTVEGSWDEVFKVIGQAHSLVHETGVARVQTSMRVGSRTDKEQSAEDKVRRVEELLAEQKK